MWQSKEGGINKILIYYILAIVLPCIGLGILAFRGVRNDQALVERDNRRKMQEVGEAVSAHLLEYLDSVELALKNTVKKDVIPDRGYYYNSVLADFTSQYPVVTAVLYFHPDQEMLMIPGDQVLYLPDALPLPPASTVSAKASQAAVDGWQYEFRDQNYARAINHYTTALTAVKDTPGRAMITNIMARIYRKQGETALAMKAYRSIADNYPDVYLQGNIPAGITGRRELIKLYLQIGDQLGLTAEVTRMLEDLMEARHPITKAYFQNTLDEVEGILSSLDSIPQALRDRMDRLMDRRKLTEYLHHFYVNANMVANLVQDQNSRSNRKMLRSNGYDYYFAIMPDNNGSWLLLYDVDLCFDRQVLPLLKAEAVAAGFDWRPKGKDQDFMASVKSHSVQIIEYNFPDGLPDWSLEFLQAPTGTVLSLLRTGQGIYLYIFLLILVILIVGLFFTLYTVNQELKLSRMKSFFISTVSHEFKSPITSIRQMAEMLDRGRVASPDRKKMYYATMLHESERLSHLIENILDFARMEEGRKMYRFETGNITQTISAVIESFRVQTEGKDIQLTFKEPGDLPVIAYDRGALEQVIHNLLDNAVKYSGKEKRIEVSLEKSGPSILIHVRDWGMGIDKAEQDKIFNRFYRAGDELTSRVKGSGIGLTILRQIVEDHQGSVSVKSKPGEGSVFTISLPIKSYHA